MTSTASPQLITMDIGHTLGAPSGASLTAVLAGLSPLPGERARRVIQRRLHTLAVLDEDTITRVCREVQIPADSFPRYHQPPRFDIWPGVVETVAELASLLPVATLSNVTRTDDEWASAVRKSGALHE
ncbi:hypothetical protein ACQP25_33510 [Microtetraspora malaysiensis]|uniref:hypothetical protein n=1 Tax=Microtetraspora malaysiensis TaxID=161358 RepID=UPI003D8EFCE5